MVVVVDLVCNGCGGLGVVVVDRGCYDGHI